MVHLILSYCKSHIYDLHSLLVGTIIFFLIIVWKGSIDDTFGNWTDKHYADRDESFKKAVVKKMWALIYLLIIVLAFLFFTAASYISPLVHNSVPASIITATFAITELEFYKTFIQKKGD